MPTWIATVRSTSTVSTKVVSSTSTSLRGARSSSHEHAPLAHVVGDHDQDPGERRQRDPARPARRRRARSAAGSARGRCRRPGVRPPFLMLVAVRAIAPVAGMPPKSGDAMLATPCADQLHVRAVAAADHAVGHHRREQRLDRAEQRDRERRRRRARGCCRRQMCGRRGTGQAVRHARRSGCRSSRRRARRAATSSGRRRAAPPATPGTRRRDARPDDEDEQRQSQADPDGGGRDRVDRARRRRSSFATKLGRHRLHAAGRAGRAPARRR